MRGMAAPQSLGAAGRGLLTGASWTPTVGYVQASARQDRKPEWAGALFLRSALAAARAGGVGEAAAAAKAAALRAREPWRP